jgi:predicted PurR-regulated permease PerM
VQGGFFLGFVYGLLNIVPYLGTILGLAVILPIAYFQPDGGFLLMLEAVGVFIVVQVLEAYVITPKVMGERTGLHPMIIILSIFFWGEALHGILGMVLAVPLTAFLVVVWRLLKNKYLPQHGKTMTPF